VRFYEIDPERVLQLPRYLLRHLTLNLPALEAAEQHKSITAGLAPYIPDHARRNLLYALEKKSARLQPVLPPVEVIEYNPQKAKEYFESIGVKVQRAASD
jgi:hypothetical protein